MWKPWGIEQLCQRVHRSTFINVSSRTSSYASTRERASGRFPSGERELQLSFGRVVQSVNRMARKERSEESGRERRGPVAGERKRRGTLYETAETRGSGTGEGLGPTDGKEEGGTRGEDIRHGGRVTAAEEKEKRCVVVVVVRMDTIRVGDRTQCSLCPLATI